MLPREQLATMADLEHSVSPEAEGMDGDDERTETELAEHDSPDSKRECHRNDGGDHPLEEHLNDRRRKHHRRGHRGSGAEGRRRFRRKWKPFVKLSWEERKDLEERERKRAMRVREMMFAEGRTVAPYNTTQFLMEDHETQSPFHSPNLEVLQRQQSNDTSNSDDMPDSPEDDFGMEAGFFEKDFSETYEQFHAESLNNMSKTDLIREYLEMEKCVERLEAKLETASKEDNSSEDKTTSPVGNDRESELRREVERLRQENAKLQAENSLLKQGRQNSAPEA
ncbi:protein HEXIM1-like [Branchiostoma floridae]|uniref:Protein HEXIM1-like n=1 Tax=Branchiostoma floridae TaxID=7739 RepID=A0A9J7HEQ1_BRAFL|nr:protein HEXIM1-like [Branchiostoma floridae]